MARIPESVIERLKNEVAVERLIESAGIVLKKSGKDLVGTCPFHDDKTPSLIVSPAKNLWHCMGACQTGGNPIDWVMKLRGLSFRHAVELLDTAPALAAQAVATPGKPERRVRVLPAPVAFDADDHALLRQTIDYYHVTLKQSPEALTYLKVRGIDHPEVIDHFKLGYANRTLGLRLPEKNRKAGADIRARLERVGIYRESGHEHFNGSIVVPVWDSNGIITEVYGRKIRDDLRKGTPVHMYLPGAHHGVLNVQALTANKEIILCEALIDALTFWCAGYRNVTSSYGIEGFTEDHLAAFKEHGTQRVLIAYDRDEAGDQGAAKVAERLMAAGIDCYRIQFPKNMDANEYALKVTPASKSLGLLIRKAEWMGKGAAPARQVHAFEVTENVPDPVPSLAADEAVESVLPDEMPEPTITSPLPPEPTIDTPVEQNDTDLILSYGERRYRIRGWKKSLNPEALKVNVLVSKDDHFHVDSFDLYHAKARAAFVKQAGVELGEAEDVLKHDLGRVLLKVEELQTAHLQAALKKEDKVVTLSETEQAAALDLLKSPNLLERILVDFDACGVVGEETNKLVGYLAAVSRQLDKPLAILIQSSSAAGKSSLMDAVLAMMPDEAQIRYSAMTGQSLFYMGETSLKHKILAIAEEEGAAQASYALKLLQSDGQVSMASTGKDATTGLLTTHEYKVEGPVMLFLTTTAIDIDEELLNRCVVLTVNESREQTKAIHILQRQRQTLQGLLADEGRDAILTLHRNAQRLLQPVKVVNPYADQLTFLDDKTRTRRDHMKYLSLIRAIAFLHQYQRPIHTVQHRGKAVRYIEVLPSDITTANRLAHDVLGRTLDELPPQTRKLLTTLHSWVKVEVERLAMKPADFRFGRRQVRELTGWGDTQLKIHLARLAELEYLLAHRVPRGQGFEYELVYDGEGDAGGRFLMGLADTMFKTPDNRTYDNQRSGVNNERSAPGRSVVGGQSGAGRQDEIDHSTNTSAALDDLAENIAPTAYLNGISSTSYRTAIATVDA
jgi:DNA primase catalytic core